MPDWSGRVLTPIGSGKTLTGFAGFVAGFVAKGGARNDSGNEHCDIPTNPAVSAICLLLTGVS